MEEKKSKNELFEWIQAIVIAVVLSLLIRHFVFEIIQVDKHSMTPTLQDGDRIVTSKISYRINDPKMGDIVIFKNPANPKENYVKRIMGTPGSIIEIRDEKVYVDGEEIFEPYIQQPTKGSFKGTVPDNHFFVMGDNRNNSRDSRDPSIGYIPFENMIGKARLRIWPLNDIYLFK